MNTIASLFGIICCFAGSAVLAQEARRAPVELVTEGFSLKMLPDRAWTFSRIDYGEKEVGAEAGFYGAVLATAPRMFVGTGHQEGGVEEVERVEVTADGQELEATTLAGVVNAERIRVVKHSRLANMSHMAEIDLQKDRIDFRYQLKAVEEAFVELIYPMMFCWTPKTTEWVAELKEGELMSGDFRSDGSWHLEKDVRWSAVYSPESGLAALLIFADDFPEGKIHRHGFWDRTMYHKQYFQGWWRETIHEGQELDCRATLLVVEAEPEQWVDAVKERVEQFRAQH